MINLRGTACAHSWLGVGVWKIRFNYNYIFCCSNRCIRCDYFQSLAYWNSCVQTFVHRMPSFKRPSSQDVESSRKRPASSIASVVAELKGNAKEDNGGDDPDSEVRHKDKGEKFHKLLKAGQLPAQVVHMWEHGAQSWLRDQKKNKIGSKKNKNEIKKK